MSAGGHASYSRVVPIENRHILRCLVRQNNFLGRLIGCHRAVAVEVIRSQIQHHSQGRAVSLPIEVLQLKAGDFEHHRGVGAYVGQTGQQRAADVAAHQGAGVVMLQDAAQE